MIKVLFLLLISCIGYGQDYVSYERIYTTQDSTSQVRDTTHLTIKEVFAYKVLYINGVSIVLDEKMGEKDNSYGFTSIYYKSKESEDKFFMVEFFYRGNVLLHICVVRTTHIEIFIVQPLKSYV